LLDSFNAFAQCVDYSLLTQLNRDPNATVNGDDHQPRQVFSGHYVPVAPTPLAHPECIAFSNTLFSELGLNTALVEDSDFIKLFSGDLTQVPSPMQPLGWATGYALSIYGTEYIQQCPFGTGNGYGDGRAISVYEGVLNGKRWEMQLKGGGPTPYCRGGDGRAVLRSSIREFLAQEYMHALGIPTSRSLCLMVSFSERVNRPWYSEQSKSPDPDIMLSNPVAISTRVAPSFLRVGQVELFSRRARSKAHPTAHKELEMIVLHVIEREYRGEIEYNLPLVEKVLKLAFLFRNRLTTLISHWLRVGYCQGNFNSDNCAVGGYTLDYGPFGFCEQFEPFFQPWTGGGRHFSFLNQPAAAAENFNTFCSALLPLVKENHDAVNYLNDIVQGFSDEMEQKLEAMWAAKLGLTKYDSALFSELLSLMTNTAVDYTLFFRKLCDLPSNVSELEESFSTQPNTTLTQQWQQWLKHWQRLLGHDHKLISTNMKKANPLYTWREWLIAPAYQKAEQGDYSLIHELQSVLNHPYTKQSDEVTHKYCQLRPAEYINAGGISHYSCSS
jgi:uncharacterized protein YdiU (UPF0061 family)